MIFDYDFAEGTTSGAEYIGEEEVRHTHAHRQDLETKYL